MVVEGFIVHAYARSRPLEAPAGGETSLYFIGRLYDGRTFAAVVSRFAPFFYVRASEIGPAQRLPGLREARFEETPYRTMDGEPCRRLPCSTAEARRQLRETLAAAGLRSYEADLRVTDQFRLERRIHGPVRLSGEARPGRHVRLVFLDPKLEPAEPPRESQGVPPLSVLSIDIETDASGSVVLAVGLCHREPPGGEACAAGEPRQRVLLLLPPGSAAPAEPWIESFTEERALLQAFQQQLQALDPDVITGWNVVEFDLRVLARRFREKRLPFRLGRSREEAVYLPQSQGRGSRVIVPGRQVLDGVRILRAAPQSFEDYSLETVAETLLGYGKRIEVARGESRLAAIGRLYREDPGAFCAYCLQDARLVQEIFARTGLLELTWRRCLLIGVAPDLAWTSIAAFEHLYTEALHERGMVAPTYGVDTLPMEAAPGGIILTPHPGVFDQVLVFDFQSLYPSIMRSFNIDPVSHVRPERLSQLSSQERSSLIRAPNGACFRREPGVLPELLDRFFESREEARRRGDPVASFVYKIILNSFYGVLGARGCRFAGSDLAGAVTSFGQQIVGWCRTFLQRRGYSVLYGDTDSLFVAGRGAPAADAEGEALCGLVNEALADHLSGSYGVQPRLTLRFEKRYSRFFLPRLRGAEQGAGKGRAKGYAGLLAGQKPPGGIEIRGMEAVRRDWTDLAHDLQIRLLEMLFLRKPLAEVQAYVQQLVRELYAGSLDGKLVYRKALRKPIGAYTRSTPPHVKAAALLDPPDRRGLIRYLMTRAGPQPEGRVSAPIDYDHYLEKQLKPIASTFAEALGTDPGTLFGESRQLSLFE
jgi:DNA polymerase-2